MVDSAGNNNNSPCYFSFLIKYDQITEFTIRSQRIGYMSKKKVLVMLWLTGISTILITCHEGFDHVRVHYVSG